MLALSGVALQDGAQLVNAVLGSGSKAGRRGRTRVQCMARHSQLEGLALLPPLRLCRCAALLGWTHGKLYSGAVRSGLQGGWHREHQKNCGPAAESPTLAIGEHRAADVPVVCSPTSGEAGMRAEFTGLQRVDSLMPAICPRTASHAGKATCRNEAVDKQLILYYNWVPLVFPRLDIDRQLG